MGGSAGTTPWLWPPRQELFPVFQAASQILPSHFHIRLCQASLAREAGHGPFSLPPHCLTKKESDSIPEPNRDSFSRHLMSCTVHARLSSRGAFPVLTWCHKRMSFTLPSTVRTRGYFSASKSSHHACQGVGETRLLPYQSHIPWPRPLPPALKSGFSQRHLDPIS